MFAAVLWIADEALAPGIDDPVEGFERYLADQDGELVADLADIEDAFSPLDRQPDGAEYRQNP